MIEKLDKNLAGNINSFNMSQNISVACKAINKINELVDAVNELQTKVNKLAPNIDFAQPEVKENVQDKFAEQRKWIGKLCWFWDDDKEAKSCGILTEIAPENHDYKGQICPCLDDGGDGYMHCEPVKPDDDIIYQGE